jgi:hypothetical protein
VGRWTTQPEMDTAAGLLAETVTGLRHSSSAAHDAHGQREEPAKTR